jgi:hypothetical protein
VATDNRTQRHLSRAGGMTTRPDVDALLAAFPPESLAPGARLSDEEVMAVIGRCGAVRYRTVYRAWVIRLLYDHQVVLNRERRAGFFVPTASQVMGDTRKTLTHIDGSARKQGERLIVTRPSEGIESKERDLHYQLLGNVRFVTKESRTTLLSDTSIKPRPQLSPPAMKERS